MPIAKALKNNRRTHLCAVSKMWIDHPRMNKHCHRNAGTEQGSRKPKMFLAHFFHYKCSAKYLKILES